MSKHSKHNRHKNKVDNHKAQAKSPGQRQQEQAQAKSQEAKDKDAKDMIEAGLTLTTDINTRQTEAKDSKDQPQLTKDDQARLDKAQKSDARAIELTRMAREAQREAKRDMEELSINGSNALKVKVQELEAKIVEAQAVVTDIDACMDTLKDKRAKALVPLNEVLAQYKRLTGFDKKSGKAKSGKAKSKAPNGNGRFTATVKAQGDTVKVLVSHIDTKSLFETSLHPDNGMITLEDWHALRHRFVAHFEAKDTMSKADQGAVKAGTLDYNLVLRAYLSNLKGKVETVKPISKTKAVKPIH